MTLVDEFSTRPAIVIQDYFKSLVCSDVIVATLGETTIQSLAASSWKKAGKPLVPTKPIPPETYTKLQEIQGLLSQGQIGPSQANDQIGRLSLY